MAKSAKMRFRRPDWLFDWKRPRNAPISSWAAILLVVGIFTFLALFLQVRMVDPVEWTAPQASVIRLGGEDWAQSLVQEARAKGPFPSRFEPGEWDGTREMRQLADQAAQLHFEGHQARLMSFPEPGIEPPPLARRGVPVMPSRWMEPTPVGGTAKLRLLPVLSVVDGIAAEELPESLPEWTGPVTDRLDARPWRFLVELDAQGRVLQSVALAGGNELSPAGLSDWLRGVVFRAKPRDSDTRWVAIAIEFHNHEISDATEPE
ncbi:MAG: hypothetical protein R3242_03680 [Akkermansiaceae bacterium]|nr:hypothetical protein [Akkermansiaceae bacterium]